jgi:nucleobase:cation symporter-1, NCS1 family
MAIVGKTRNSSDVGSRGSGTLKVEQHGINHIPPEDRHGRAWTLLTFWGGGNVTVVAASIGVAVVSLGLSFWWAILAVVIGNLTGGVFMAYHSVQGPRLGVPQMLQTRAQFGFYGALFPVCIVLMEYLGALVLADLIGGSTIASLTGLSSHVSMIITAAVLLFMTWLGYHVFHAFNRVVLVLSFILFVALLVKLITLASGPSLSVGKLTFGTLMLAITICASWQITYAPLVADYSRYLPESTSSRATFAYTYAGSVGGSVFSMVVGALGAVTVKSFGGDTANVLGSMFPGAGGLIIFVLFLGLVASNYELPYGAYLCALTALSREGRFGSVVRLRIIVTTLVSAVCLALAFASSGSISTFINNFFAVLLIALIPWTAINLTDFYFVRRGHYQIQELFKVDGVYGRVNVASLIIYAVTLAIEVPFMNISWYEGPIAKALGGGDISWLVGLAFAAPVYYVVARRQLLPGTQPGELLVPTRTDADADFEVV